MSCGLGELLTLWPRIQGCSAVADLLRLVPNPTLIRSKTPGEQNTKDEDPCHGELGSAFTSTGLSQKCPNPGTKLPPLHSLPGRRQNGQVLFSKHPHMRIPLSRDLDREQTLRNPHSWHQYFAMSRHQSLSSFSTQRRRYQRGQAMERIDKTHEMAGRGSSHLCPRISTSVVDF